MPAATTRRIPRPVRETAIAARRPSSATTSCGRGGGGGGSAVGADSVSGAGFSPKDWRQISAPPAAISTSGQTRASENQMPSARTVRSTATSSSPVPSATSTDARPDLIRTRAGRESPAGIRSQPSP